MKKVATKDFVLIALLIGLNIVLSRILSINTWNIKIGFSFLTVYLAAYLYGPIGGALVGGFADLIGALIFPTGPYYPAFTLTAVLMGVVFGLVLKKSDDIKRIIITVLINEIILSLCLNTYWISVLFNTKFLPLFLTRSIECIIMVVVEVVSIKLLVKYLPSLERRFKQ